MRTKHCVHACGADTTYSAVPLLFPIDLASSLSLLIVLFSVPLEDLCSSATYPLPEFVELLDGHKQPSVWVHLTVPPFSGCGRR